MDADKIITSIKKHLQERYADYVNKQFTNRLILSDRQDLLKYLGKEVNADELNRILQTMEEKGYILEDTGILITFNPVFLV